MQKMFKLGFILMLVLALVFVFTVGCAPKVIEEDDGDLEGIEDELNGDEDVNGETDEEVEGEDEGEEEAGDGNSEEAGDEDENAEDEVEDEEEE